LAERAESAAAVDASSRSAPLIRSRQAYFAITLLIAGIVAWGFWETYYARFAERTDLPSIVHVHAAVFTVWVLVLVAQAAVIVGGNVQLHRWLGTLGMAYGALVLAVGLGVSVGAPALRVRAGDYSLDVGGVIVLYNLMDILLFGAFLAMAFAYRNRAELHKRWIVAATAALCGAALGRVVPGNTAQYLLLWLSPILAMVAVDLVTTKRVHAIPLASGGLLVIAFFKVPLLAAPLWRDLGRALLRPVV
jgi:hypothetical protein